MNQKKYTSPEVKILVKFDEPIWQDTLEPFKTPNTLSFIVSGLPVTTKDTIKKISWDFGDNKGIKTITSRKINISPDAMYEHKYHKLQNTTLCVAVSVYTENVIFVPDTIELRAVNKVEKEHYVEPAKFKDQIVEYYKTGKMTDDVADSVQKIANRLAFAPNFINYSYREEMVGDALIKMMEALVGKKFDPAKGNPFSYFTKIAFHAFCNRIKKEKKNHETRLIYQQDIYDRLISDGIISPNAVQSEQVEDYNESYE